MESPLIFFQEKIKYYWMKHSLYKSEMYFEINSISSLVVGLQGVTSKDVLFVCSKILDWNTI